MDKMTMKEAGRYANFLKETEESLYNITANGMESKLVKITETHRKSLAYKEAEDEIIEREFDDMVDTDIDTITGTIKDLIEEKMKLSAAIAEAKKKIKINIGGTKVDLDSAVEYAKNLRRMSYCYFHPLVMRKPSKNKKEGKAYAFNVDGNQSPYFYQIEVETKLLFDKNKIIKLDKENKKLADEISKEIDKKMSEDIIEFVPKYNYLDSVEDILNNFK